MKMLRYRTMMQTMQKHVVQRQLPDVFDADLAQILGDDVRYTRTIL